jgi:TIR domain/Protein of unknown function (DUF2510)
VRIFVSYARRDRGSIDALLQDMRRARHEVWVDEELTGGQSWWDTILGTIRGADLFVVALSPDWLASKACAAELNYAVACNRTLLPIMVGRVSPQMAPRVVADSQIVDYLERTPDTAIALVTALSTARPPGPLPQPLPDHPTVPMSYMNTFRERVDELSLSFQQQSLLLSELRAHLADDDTSDSAMELIRRLRRRGDITESIGKEIDSLLASPTTSTTRSADTVVKMTPAGWFPDPYRRYEQRYWDGTAWTEYASRGGQRVIDAPPSTSTGAAATQATAPQSTASNTIPVATNPSGKWNGGTFVWLLILSLIPYIGLIGVIIGAVNLKKPGRHSQAMALLIIGIASTALALIANTQLQTGSDSGF